MEASNQPVLTVDQADKLMRRAEHEVCYGAKRAVEMYLPVYAQEAAFYLFRKCAEHYGLSESEILKCRDIMDQFGMLEEQEKKHGSV